MRIQERGLSVDLPAGWEGDFYRREPDAGPLSGAEKTYTVAHMANRSLPPNRGDFGSGVVELMGPDDVLVVLFEYGPESVGTALFSHQGPPWPLKAGRFGPNSLQRPLPGQGGLQQFFTMANRAFCVYVVLGQLGNARAMVPQVNAMLRTMTIAELSE